MRYVLAIVAFVIAAPFMAFGAYIAFVVVQVFVLGHGAAPDFKEGLRLEAAIAGGALVIGFAFIAAGVSMLASKPRRE